MESVISAVFKVESEGYQALTELKRLPVTDAYVISQAALLKKANGNLKILDAFDTGAETSDDTVVGGLIGGLLGILGGPVGVLLTGSVGALVGSALDTDDAIYNASLMEKVSEQFVEGEVAIVALAQETADGAVTDKLSKFDVSVVREDAAEVAEEVRRAQELQKEMAREAKKRLREEKKAERSAAIEERREKMKADFEELKRKFTKK